MSILLTVCMLFYAAPEDVARAVGILSKASQCRFAVRGGGHTGWSGAANTDSGITFDLSRLNSTTVDGISVKVGAGARWNSVYEHLDALGPHIAGGRFANVGVAGLTLGGGISFFSPQYGWVCDSVLSFELVMANGDLEVISLANKPDLFRALKGGSNNFGIVTAFRFKAIEGGDVLVGSGVYDAAYTDDLATAFVELATTPIDQYDPYASFAQIHSWDEQSRVATKVIVNTFTYTKLPAVNNTPPFLSKLQDAAPQLVSTLNILPLQKSFSDVNNLDNPSTPRRVLINMNFHADAAFMIVLIELLDKTITQLLDQIPQSACSIAFQPLHPIINSKSNTTGGNVIGLDSGYIINVNPTIQWDGAEKDAIVKELWERTFAEAQRLAKAYGVATDWVYLNYAERWQDPIKGYGSKNVEFMRGVSRKYDPKGIFQRQLEGGFKLWRQTND